MPNLNFTSSSFAQQDRYAQTTVSYESRNMQSIPFYPGVDHRARLRGIMALTLVFTVIIGACLGAMFGLRDYISDWFEGTPTYVADASDEDDSNLPDKDSMNVSKSADANLTYVKVNGTTSNKFSTNKHVIYNGAEQKIEYGVAEDIENPNDITFSIEWIQTADSDGNKVPDYPKDAADEWPINAGTYKFEFKIYMNGGYSGDTRTVFLYIDKATPDNPGLILPGVDNLTYNRQNKDVVLASSIPSDYTGTWQITYRFNGQSKKVLNNTGKVNTKNAVKDAGNYVFSIEFLGDDNYSAITYNNIDTLEIKKSSEVKPIHFANAFTDVKFTYDGDPKSTEIVFNKIEGLSSDIKEDLIAEIKNTVKYSYNIPTPTEVGKYLVTAIINSSNYDIEKVQTTLEITKGNLTSFFTFKNVTTTYTGSKVPRDLLEIVRDKSFPDAIAEGIIVTYEYKDSKGKTLPGGADDIINAGTYKVVATFATGDNYETPDPMEITLTIKKADIDPKNVTVTPLSNITYSGRPVAFPMKNITIDGLKRETDFEAIKIEYPEIVDAGKHTVPIKIIGGTNYNNLEVEALVTIDRAPYDEIYVTALAIQFQTKNGDTQFTPEVLGVPEGSWVEYWVGGEQVEGISRLGRWDVRVVVTDGNHEYVIEKIEFTIQFNWLTIIMGIALGVVAALIIAPSIWGVYHIVEKRSFRKFARLRARVLRERGGRRGAIVCEAHTMILNWNSEQEIRDFPWVIEPRFGRLFLTHATIEYYDNDYKKNYKNILVQLKDVTGIEIRGFFLRNKLIVFAKSGRHVFYVAPNTAFLWRRDIIHFRNLQHLYPMENNVVDNDYPFNYDVIDHKSESRKYETVKYTKNADTE